MNFPDNFYRRKRVFITGHTGFKGSWLCLFLHKLGADIYGYALNPPTEPSLFKLAHIDGFVSSVIGDIRDLNKLRETIQQVQPEIVIHMAAQPLVRESYIHPIETYQTNVIGTANLLEACRNIPSIKAIVNVTTDKCYENKEWFWGYRENEPLGGHDPYSSSKACSELVTSAYRNSFFSPKDYHEHGIAIASARAGNVIGGGDWAEDRLIPDFIRALLQKKQVTIRNPHAIRPWQHVMEPLTGYLMLAERLYSEGTVFGEAWNFGPDDNDAQNVEWVIKTICDLWGNDASYAVESNNQQPHEATYLKLDCSKAKVKLGWHPVWNIQKALQAVVEWNKAYFEGAEMKSITEKQIDEYLQSLNDIKR